MLFLVRENDGASAGMLADSLKVTPSTLTRIMDRLVVIASSNARWMTRTAAWCGTLTPLALDASPT
jgi:hypothetical protein